MSEVCWRCLGSGYRGIDETFGDANVPCPACNPQPIQEPVMSEVFDPNKVERWDCQAGQMLDGGTVAVMVGADDGEYVYAWQFDQLLALYRELCARHWPEPLKQ